MQALSIIRQATIPFIVKYGSNKCKIKNMKTMDGTNYNSESFKILENLYKQEVIAEEFIEYTATNNSDEIQKRLYYEAYIEPTLNKIESYITKKYGKDQYLKNIIEEVKLEFATGEYILDYYSQMNSIKQENKETDNSNHKNKAKIRIMLGNSVDITSNVLEYADLELNINKDITVIVHLMPHSTYDASILISTLAEFVKSGKLDSLINSAHEAKLIRLFIQNNYEVSYIIYNEYNEVLAQNTIKVVEQKRTIVTILTAILVFILKAGIITASAGVILLFMIALIRSLSNSFVEKLTNKLHNKVYDSVVKALDERPTNTNTTVNLYNTYNMYTFKTLAIKTLGLHINKNNESPNKTATHYDNIDYAKQPLDNPDYYNSLPHSGHQNKLPHERPIHGLPSDVDHGPSALVRYQGGMPPTKYQEPMPPEKYYDGYPYNNNLPPERTTQYNRNMPPERTTPHNPIRSLPSDVDHGPSALVRYQGGMPPTKYQEPIPPTNYHSGMPPAKYQEPIPPTNYHSGMPPAKYQEPIPHERYYDHDYVQHHSHTTITSYTQSHDNNEKPQLPSNLSIDDIQPKKAPPKYIIVRVYTIMALILLSFIFKIIGLPLYDQASMFIIALVNVAIRIDEIGEFIYAIKYIIDNLGETFKIFITDTSIYGIAYKTLIVTAIIYAAVHIIYGKSDKQKSSAPSPDRLLTEVQVKFK
jgi:hypothetical protein